jgi:predicted aldo/keto reductase-like oxidoreductase
MLAAGLPGWLAKAERCTGCRLCESRCPFHLHIVDGLQESLALARRLRKKPR